MKILMLISSLEIGGAETHVAELSAALAGLGNSVCVVSGGGALTETLAAGVEHITLPIGSRNPIRLALAYLSLGRLLRGRRFDVIHAHSRIAAYIGERAARREGICFVTTAHAKFEATLMKKYMSEWGYYVSAVSEDIALYLREVYGVRRERICVIPNGIDTRKFSPPKHFVGRDRRILFASRLDGDCSDGAYALLGIAPMLAEKYPDISISVAGGGSEYEKLSAMARSVNLAVGYECVCMLGARKDMNEIFAGHGIFVGVSRAALEAMACGACVVLAGNEGFLGVLDSDRLQEAEKSNFCARGSGRITQSALLSEIERLLIMSGEDRARLSLFLRDYVARKHSIDRTALRTASFYREALRRSGIGRGDVCLCGYYGYGNTGDDVLLAGAIRRARREYGDGICALTRRPHSDRYRYGVVCASVKNPFSVWREIGSARCLAFGGGTIFQDRTSLRSLVYYSLIARAAHKRGVRVELWANGLGPIKSALGRRMVRGVLEKCDHLGFRDRRSVALALEMGAQKDRIELEEDLAFYIAKEKRRESVSLTRGRYAVISVSGKGSSREIELVFRRAKALAQSGARLIFVGMYPAEDKKISRSIAPQVGGEYIEGLSPEELVGLLSGAELCLGMRLHLLIFSSIAGTRFEGVGEDPKIRAFCEERGGRYLEC